MFLLQFGDAPYIDQRAVLGGKNFNITMRYNKREDRWAMDIRDAINGKYILRGLKVMQDDSITGIYNTTLSPLGHFAIFNNLDWEDKEDYVSRDNFGLRKQYALIFFDEEY